MSIFQVWTRRGAGEQRFTTGVRDTMLEWGWTKLSRSGLFSLDVHNLVRRIAVV